jgi:glycosyltransferase involved in cell wall biosynthesis
LKISVCVPCYNEENSIPVFAEKLVEQIDNDPRMRSIDECEVIFVDDGSSDKTLETIKSLCDRNTPTTRYKYVSFSRNFGKEAAMLAGLQYSSGELVAIMDADLQDPPELLPEMFRILSNEDSYDYVAARRVSRKGEPVIRSFFARAFYWLMARFTDMEIVDGARDFRMMTRAYADALLSLKEYNRFSKGLFSWVGFRGKWLEYENRERMAGESKWSFLKLVSYAIDGAIGFTTQPLRLASIIGIVLSFVSIAAIAFLVIRRLAFDDPVSGWASTVCIVLLIGGIQLFCIGIIGEYLAKTYLETKGRPVFIIRERNV